MTRIALLGGGYWGSNILHSLKRLPDVEVSFCDPDPTRIARVRTTYPDVPTTPDHMDVIGDNRVEAVCVATPASTHHEICKAALLNGKHVYVEKPLALTSSHARELVRLSEETGRTLLVGHVFRYSTAAEAVKRLIDTGEIGELRFIHSVRTSLGPRVREDTSALWDYSIHDIYLTLHFVGLFPETISAWGEAFLRPHVEDVVFLKLNFAGGVMAHFHGSWYDPLKRRDVTLIGSRGAIRYDESSPDEKVVLYPRGWEPADGRDARGNEGFTLFDGDGRVVPVEECEPLLNECRHFVECVRTGSPPRTGGDEGLRTVRVAEAAERSLKSKGRIVFLDSEGALHPQDGTRWTLPSSRDSLELPRGI